jgi:hypothetical protein
MSIFSPPFDIYLYFLLLLIYIYIKKRRKYRHISKGGENIDIYQKEEKI